jgi:hypothetical protein
MADIAAGQQVRVTIRKAIGREGARKTIERLFMKDKSLAKPLAARQANFKPLPKRRGGRIWTKWPSKLHLDLTPGTAATIKVTPQAVKDLNSVKAFVDVAAV